MTKKSGIYGIHNLINDKWYIGQSIELDKRLYTHKTTLNRNLSTLTRIQRAFNKHGAENFEIIILEECSPEQLDQREIYWIQFYDSYQKGYNGTTGGKGEYKVKEDSSNNKLNWSEERRKEWSEKMMKTKLERGGKCLVCGERTNIAHEKYCENHKIKCLQCGKRETKNRWHFKNKGENHALCDDCYFGNGFYMDDDREFICSVCGKHDIKNGNKQKMCKECYSAKEKMRKQEYNVKRRNNKKEDKND